MSRDYDESDIRSGRSNHSIAEEIEKKRKCNYLSNRLLVGALAICMLWLTSMQICVSLVQSYIASPVLQQAVDQCVFTFDVTNQQKNDYDTCVNLELQTCRDEFDAALQLELERSRAKESENKKSVQQAQSVQEACGNDVVNAKVVIKAWEYQGSSLHPLMTYPSCSSQKREDLDILLNQNAFVSTALSATSEVASYSVSSNLILSQLSAQLTSIQLSYEGVISSNQAHFITGSQLWMNNATLQTSFLLNQSSSSVNDIVATLLSCVGSSNTASVTPCIFGSSLIDLYIAQKAAMDAQLIEITSRQQQTASAIASYENDVSNAFQNFDSFYQSVVGPNGLIGQLTSAMTQLGLPVNTCGLTNPSWCIFTASSWAVALPSLVGSFSLTTMLPPETIWSIMETEVIPAVNGQLAAVSAATQAAVAEELSATLNNIEQMADETAVALDFTAQSNALLVEQKILLEVICKNVF